MYAFLNLTGIEGESEDSEYTKQIELQSFSWGSSNNSSFRHGTGSGIGAGNVSDMEFSKFTDKASLNLQLYCTQGKVIPQAQVTLLKLQGTEKLDYFKISMSNVVVTSYLLGASNDGRLPLETFRLSCVQFHATYKPQGNVGSAEGNVEFGWNSQEKKQA